MSAESIANATDDVTVLRGGTGASAEADAAPRILKQRFILEEKLGSGGMGTVYRARDLRKVEAQDRNPYVAIKVLNNDFRTHPDAFIALQREASKSQGIAHPNIVSIFDFDKDGDIPYMTMELLRGRELATLLKDYPNGLPDSLAWRVVDGLCAGLKRAHDAGITHSDFKPGNILVTDDGTAKILDFGIARAVRTHQYGGDETVFDPAKLAALTPTFASREMLDGETPQPADDVYSLGVVVYLMLTGRHPYDRVRADEARARGLRPERIKRLTRRRWRTLAKMLEFDRGDRPQTMDEVVSGLLRTSPARPWIVVGLGAIVIAAASSWLGSSGVDRARVERDALVGAQMARIDALLTEPTFDQAWQRRLDAETESLATLDGDVLRTTQARVLDALRARIAATTDFDTAYPLLVYADARAGGYFASGHAIVEARAAAELRELVRSGRTDAAWVDEAEARYVRFAQAFPRSTVRAELEQELGEAYVVAIQRLVGKRNSVAADRLMALATPKVFDPDAFGRFDDRLAALRQSFKRAQVQAARRADAAGLNSELAELTTVDCARADAAAAGTAAASLRSRYAADTAKIDAAITTWLAACVAEVGTVDFDRAVALRQAALTAFPEADVIAESKLDPCALPVLVGKGATAGRGGICADDLGEGLQGPPLVVVADGDRRFAIGKFEVAGRDLKPFCDDTQQCTTTADGGTPATVGIELAVAYAEWLSQRSGRDYRLPRREEWERVARAGWPDPSRNCRARAFGRSGEAVDVTVGAQNELGVVNLFGNVREWVIDDGQPVAMGGSFADPMGECDIDAARTGSNAGNALTGMRLVRELP